MGLFIYAPHIAAPRADLDVRVDQHATAFALGGSATAYNGSLVYAPQTLITGA